MSKKHEERVKKLKNDMAVSLLTCGYHLNNIEHQLVEWVFAVPSIHKSDYSIFYKANPPY